MSEDGHEMNFDALASIDLNWDRLAWTEYIKMRKF